MWIKIAENNNYVPVVYEQRKNTGAGGVYELQEVGICKAEVYIICFFVCHRVINYMILK